MCVSEPPGNWTGKCGPHASPSRLRSPFAAARRPNQTPHLLVLRIHQPAGCARIASHRISSGAGASKGHAIAGAPLGAARKGERDSAPCLCLWPLVFPRNCFRPFCPTEHTGELRDGRMTYAEQRLRSPPRPGLEVAIWGEELAVPDPGGGRRQRRGKGDNGQRARSTELRAHFPFPTRKSLGIGIQIRCLPL
jgi:hypothetical protein